jgi:hypothetical protein
MEDGTISSINAYSPRQGRRLHTTTYGSQRIAISDCQCYVKKEIKPFTLAGFKPGWGFCS